MLGLEICQLEDWTIPASEPPASTTLYGAGVASSGATWHGCADQRVCLIRAVARFMVKRGRQGIVRLNEDLMSPA